MRTGVESLSNDVIENTNKLSSLSNFAHTSITSLESDVESLSNDLNLNYLPTRDLNDQLTANYVQRYELLNLSTSNLSASNLQTSNLFVDGTNILELVAGAYEHPSEITLQTINGTGFPENLNVNASLLPHAEVYHTIGLATQRWTEGHFNGLYAQNLYVNDQGTNRRVLVEGDTITINYNDLVDKPDLGGIQVDYATQVTNKPDLEAITVDYSTQVTNTPDLGAITVDYISQVTNKPDVILAGSIGSYTLESFSGNLPYSRISNPPVIPVIPGWVSAATYFNDDNRDIVKLNANLDCGQIRVTPIASWNNSYTGKVAMTCGTSSFNSDLNGRIIQGSDAVNPLDIPTFRQIPKLLSELQNDVGFITGTSADWATLTGIPQWLQDVDYFPTASLRPAIRFTGHRAIFESANILPPLPDSDVSINCGTSSFDTSLMGRIQYVRPGINPYDVVVKSQMEAAINAATLNGGGTPSIPDNLSVVTVIASSAIGSPLGDFTTINGFVAGGAINMNSNRVTGLGDPVSGQDAVTLSFAEGNYAKIDATGRLVLKSGGTTLPCFSISEVSQQILPPDVNPNWDIEALNSITPSQDLVYNLGQAGLMWRNAFIRNVVSHAFSAPPSMNIVFAKQDMTGDVDSVWEIDTDTNSLVPSASGTQNIGSPAARVDTVFCSAIGSPSSKVGAMDIENVNCDTAVIDVAYSSILNVSTLLSTDALEVAVGADIPALTSALITMSGDIAMNAGRITTLNSPLNDTDAANKVYVDNATASLRSSVDNNAADIAALTAEVEAGFEQTRWTFVPRGRLYLNVAIPLTEFVTTWSEDPNFVIGARSFLRIPPVSGFNVVLNVPLAEWPINMTTAVGTYEIWSGVERPAEVEFSGDMSNSFLSVAVQPDTNYTIRLEVWPANPAGRGTDEGVYQTHVTNYIRSAAL